MVVLVCGSSLRRLQVVLALALVALVFAPGASAAPPLDTVNVTGSGSAFFNVSINAQSGTSGQNPSGTVSFPIAEGSSVISSGPVTCLTATGPDQGGGTRAAPTKAVLTFFDQTLLNDTVTLLIVDNGGGGTDTMSVGALGRAPGDCSPATALGATDTLTNGRAVVFDAPVLPTSTDQCEDGGWTNFPQFKNQGDCVSFVENGK